MSKLNSSDRFAISSKTNPRKRYKQHRTMFAHDDVRFLRRTSLKPTSGGAVDDLRPKIHVVEVVANNAGFGGKLTGKWGEG